MNDQTIAPIGRHFGLRARFDAWRAGGGALPEEIESDEPEETIERESAPEVTARRLLIIALILVCAYLLWSIFSPLFGAMILGPRGEELPTRPTLRSTVGPVETPAGREEAPVAPSVEQEAAPPEPEPEPEPEVEPVREAPPPPPPAPLIRNTRSAVVADASEWIVAEAAYNGATMTDAAPDLYGAGGVFDDGATRAAPAESGEGAVQIPAGSNAGALFDSAPVLDAPEADYLAPESVEIERVRARPSSAGGHLTIGAGRLIECPSSRPIVTTLPGTATCTIPRDVYGDSGEVVLIPRGTEVLGQYAPKVRGGGRRIDIVWSLARTGEIDIPFNSRSAGPDGAAGAPARIDTHFGERFAAAMLVSIVDEAIGAATRAQSAGATVSLDGTARSGSKVAEAVIEESIGIDATGTVPIGTPLMIDVQRDIDFSGVYALEPIR